MREIKKPVEINIKMINGLMGFEETLEYMLKPIPDNPHFFWLEGNGGPSFILTRPQIFFQDYQVEIPGEDLKDMFPEEGDIQVYSIVTVPDKLMDMTANLLAPLLVNEKKGLARQVVLQESSYTTRHYLFPPERRRDCG